MTKRKLDMAIYYRGIRIIKWWNENAVREHRVGAWEYDIWQLSDLGYSSDPDVGPKTFKSEQGAKEFIDRRMS